MKRDRFVLAGYFGFGNAGDEMILGRLLAQDPGAPWEVLSGAGRWNPLALAALFRRGRALVLGGGELFQDRTSFFSLLYYLLLPLWARLWGCPFFAFGVGIDPDISPLGRRLTAAVLKGASGIWVRDGGTAAVLRDAGLTEPLPIVPDSAWSWPPQKAAPPSALKRVLWVLRPGEGGVDWAAVLNEWGRDPGWEHGFLPFHPEEDMAGLTRLRSRLGFFSRLEPWKELEEIFKIIGRYDAVVSMRFHGLVAAVLCGRPAVAVAAHGKVADLAAALGLPVLQAGEAAAASLRRALAAAAESRERTAAQCAPFASEARSALSDLASRLASKQTGPL